MKTKFFLSLLFILSYTIVSSQMDYDKSDMSIVKSAKDNDLNWGGCPDFMPEGCSISVLHGDPSKPNVDILFKVPAGSDIPNHWHNSAERMILLEGELTVTYEGENPVQIKKGNYAYGPSKKPHIAKCSKKSSCVLFIAFEEPLDAFPFVKSE